MVIDTLRLQTRSACEAFLRTAPPSAIAAQLRHDHALATSTSTSRTTTFNSSSSNIPSLLVHFVPKVPSTGAAHKPNTDVALADKIAIQLSLPDGFADSEAVCYTRPPVPLSICRLRYTSILSTIRAYTTSLPFPHLNPPPVTDTDLPPPVASTGGITTHLRPTEADLVGTLKVLSYLQLPRYGALHVDTPLSTLVDTVQSLLVGHSPGDGTSAAPPPPTPRRRKDHCYICQYAIPPHLHHPFYPTLCRPCGDFNVAESSISLPDQLRPYLPTPFTAVVTGARVNLGYYTTLRLLRAGAFVLATSRYPYDAQERYKTEADCGAWIARLRVVGADFRSARDAFELVGVVGGWLDEVAGGGKTGKGKLNLLVNNAAQTVTDRVEKERGMVEGENIIKRKMLTSSSTTSTSSSAGTVVVIGDSKGANSGGGYTARVGGGMPVGALSPRLLVEDDTGEQEKETRSSWSQALDEIPYQDIITAHSINAFVPLILMRELMRRLSIAPAPPTTPPTEAAHPIPNGYIITLTSRESLQELSPSQATKSGKHVHTNMSKAAVNMLVHTEASEAWKKNGVAVVAVDPGYMSADGEWVGECVERRGQRGGATGGGEAGGVKPVWVRVGYDGERECPRDWEVGVGRTLWVVAKGVRGDGAVWGRVLKHFTAVRG
jgi:NAD(P)-dependent dehydrogenase (short-subunit alcohol dehydrogenase family)